MSHWLTKTCSLSCTVLVTFATNGFTAINYFEMLNIKTIFPQPFVTSLKESDSCAVNRRMSKCVWLAFSLPFMLMYE